MSKRVGYHILFWFSYLLFKTYLNFSTGNYVEKGFSVAHNFIISMVPQVLFLCVKIPLVYLLFILIDKYLSKKYSKLKSVLYFVSLYLVAIYIYIIINHYMLNWFLNIKIQFIESVDLASFLYTFFILFFTTGIAVTLKLIRMNIYQKEVSQELLKMKLETELHLLKSQINPHFLFNTLNNIYALSLKKSDDTSDAVMKLSKLLRFMLYESRNDRILLTKEVKILEDYIDLERIRYNSRLLLNYRTDITSRDSEITPLLLLPFIENAFKHGANGSSGSVHVDIVLIEDMHKLKIRINNSKESTDDGLLVEGIGLKNVRRQLELTYSDFTLEIKNLKNVFHVILDIDLDSYGKI